MTTYFWKRPGSGLAIVEAEVVHSWFIQLTGAARSLLIIVSLLAPMMFTACGARNGSTTMALPPADLPPAIPAAEPVLLYSGTGTTPSDVSAVEAVLSSVGLGYTIANATQLNAMSEQQLAGYKLIIIPGGNSITIGQNLTAGASSAIRGAVQDYGVHYLGICAGAFFGGYSTYNGVNLTAGLSFDFYADEFKGIHLEPVEISLPSNPPLDVYWQDGPQLSGWGEVVAKFPDGTPAIVEGESGKGFVIFTGVHLEAPESWRGSLNFTTPVSVDLAFAETVIKAALDGTPLPHF